MVFLRRFNTSHVTLYRCDRGFHFCTKASFQYISCYSLSSSGVTVTSSSTCFNTSHVTLYLEVHDKQKHCRSFNTSHVTLYRCLNRTHSGHYGRFNTSHVTLYPMERRIAETVNKFQYISCYSLSQSLQFLRLDPVVSIHLMLLFILDMTVLLFRSLFVSIHLMLLFIESPHLETLHLQEVSIHLMLLFINYSLSAVNVPERFNTSHVTLYLKRLCRLATISNVSIHLMLLFISPITANASDTAVVSIHLMLLFIACWNCDITRKIQFQYISCYSLSTAPPVHSPSQKKFQYISCYSLSLVL